MTSVSTVGGPAWNRAKETVKSWMEHELQCVTSQRISQSTSLLSNNTTLSREEASTLLHELIHDDSKTNYQITTCTPVQEGEATTVFRLRTSTSKPQDENAVIVALACLESTETLASAHERDMVQWRNEFLESREGNNHHFPSTGSILASDEVHAAKQVQVTQRSVVATTQSSSTNNATTSTMFKGKKAKATTAASFFAKQKDTKQTSKKPVSKKTSKRGTTTAPKPTLEKENSPNESASQRNSTSTITKSTKIGNADDFVADEEESDDESFAAKETKPISRVRKQAPPRRPVLESDDEDEEEQPEDKTSSPPGSPTRGAMDDFTATVHKKDGDGRRKKRRKKTVTKTTMVNGYLKTENQTVWEDVPTDEEEEKEKKITKKVAAKKKPASKGNGGGMKQMGLGAFFAKK